MTNFRKRALSNLAMARSLRLSNDQIKDIAKKSFQNLMITCLEYEKFAKEDDIHKIATCRNFETANQLLKDGKGVIFFCGHQANWEILFLEGTSRMPGVAIGKPTKNKYLYNWVLSIRQKFGGTIITPKNAIKEGLRTLKQAKFLGIVGDQGMPDSGFCSPFLGRMSWTSPIPAMLSYRSSRPIIVATTLRQNGKYVITYSEPIWPDTTKSMEEEIPRLMKESLLILERSIIAHPDQWMWQHNRWKQQLPGKLPRSLRHDSLCVIFSKTCPVIQNIQAVISSLRVIYPTESITFMMPYEYKNQVDIKNEEVLYYNSEKGYLLDDLRFKLVIDLTNNPKVKKHYLKRSAFTVLSLDDILTSSSHNVFCTLQDLLKQTYTHARS
jgi:KDO2-lipid IV(A) lauroyltransferase